MAKRAKANRARRAESAPRLTARLRVLAGVVVIVVAAFIAYFPSLGGWFVYDDVLLLTDNRLIKAADGLYRFWFTAEAVDYWPVLNSTLWVEWRLWGTDPTGYHVTNLVLHIIDTLLIWVILQRLAIPGAFLAALLFAVHPVNVESVAWISQCKNLLAMLFFLLSILCYLNAENESASDPSVGGASLVSRWYWLSVAAFALAMLSKTSVAVLPLVLLWIVWWMRPLTRQDLARTAPFFVVAAVLVRVTLWFRGHGTEAQVATAGVIERVLGAGGVVWFYLSKALLPIHLAFLYPQWDIDVTQVRWWLPALGALSVTGVLWWYRREWSRPPLFAWGYFCLALLPVMGLADIGLKQHLLVADHYQHLALIGVVALVGAGWSLWRMRARDTAQWAPHATATAAAAALMVLTWQQSRLYTSPISLYQATLEENPGSWVAHNNLASALAHSGRLPEAIEHYEQALRLKPDYSDAEYNLGIALAKAGDPQNAISHYEQALHLKSDYPEAHNNLGAALADTGRLSEAIDHYQQALQLNPDYPEAHYNLGDAFLHTGQLDAAADHYERALRLRPNYPKAEYNLGVALAEAGQPEKAVGHFREAVRLNPDDPKAQNDLGSALLQTNQLQEAIRHYEQALRLKADFPIAEYNLGLALAQAGRLQEAIAHYEEALRLRPDYADARNNLNAILAMKQNAGEGEK